MFVMVCLCGGSVVGVEDVVVVVVDYYDGVVGVVEQQLVVFFVVVDVFDDVQGYLYLQFGSQVECIEYVLEQYLFGLYCVFDYFY